MNDAQNTIPSCGQEAPTHLSRLQMMGLAVLAVLLYLVLMDAAVESFVSHSPLRWIICGMVAGYVALSMLSWRKLSWTTKASVSIFVLFSLMAFAAWRPAGSDSPLTLLRQPTSTLLSAATILGILLAGWVLGRFKFLPWPARVALVLLAAYGVAGFVVGIIARTPYSALLHGGGLWEKAPFWLQGAFLGAVVVLPAALLLQLATGVSQIRAGELRNWGTQVLVLGLCATIAASGITSAAGLSAYTAAVQESTLTPEQANQAYQEKVSAARDALKRAQATFDSYPKQLYDLDALAASITTPQAAFEFVRDQIAVEPYPGIMKGASGAFLTHGANDLDRSLLLAALLSAQKVTVQVAHGKLTDEQATTLLQQIAKGPDAVDLMLKSLPAAPPNPPSAQTPQDEKVRESLQRTVQAAQKQYTDESNSSNAVLLSSLRATGITVGQDQSAAQIAILKDHYWVQASIDGKTVDLDPGFSNASVGQKFAEASETLGPGSLPDELNQTITLRLAADYLQESKTTSKELLTQQFKTVDLWGKNIRVAVVPASDSPDVNDFQPMLVAGDDQRDGQVFQLHRQPDGTQEPSSEGGGVDTGATGAAGGLLGGLGGEEEQAPAPKPKLKPAETAGGPVLARVLLEFTSAGPHLADAHAQRVILDRLESVQGKPQIQAAFADERVVRPLLTQIWDGAIGVGPFHPFFVIQTILRKLWTSQGPMEKALAANYLGKTFDRSDLPDQTLETGLISYFLASSTGPRGTHLGNASGARRYYERARLAFLRHGFTMGDWSNPGTRPVYSEGIDLINSPFAFVGSQPDVFSAALGSGVSDTVLEHVWSPGENASNTVPLVTAALQQKIHLITIKPKEITDLRSVSVPPSIRAVLEGELSSGHILVLPTQLVQLDGRGTFGWWSIDPSTGYAIGKMELGGAQATSDYMQVLKKAGQGFAITLVRKSSCLVTDKKPVDCYVKAIRGAGLGGIVGAIFCGMGPWAAGILGGIATDLLSAAIWGK